MKTILAVDDDVHGLYLLQALLQGHGFEVACATNGRAALERARRHPPDLVITDVLMPIMDGFALCREWASDPSLGRIPIVLYTGTYTEPKDEELAMSLGATLFLHKPLEPDDLLAALRPLLERPLRASRARTAGAPPAELEQDLEQYNRRLVTKLESKVQDLKLARRKLAQANARLTAVINATDDAVVAVAPDDRITSWSRNAERILEWTAAEMVGRSPDELIPIGLRTQFRDKELEARSRWDGTAVRLETQCLTRSGRAVDVEMALTSLGPDLGLAAVIHDLTKRRQAQEALEASAQWLETLLAAGPVIVWWLVPTEGAPRVEWVSPNVAALLGWSAAVVRSAEWWDGNVSLDAAPSQARWVAPTAREPAREIRVATRDGGARWMREDVSTLRRGSDEESGVVVTWADVTRERLERVEREALRTQFLHAQKMEAVGRLAGGVTHDFNNLLVVILSCANLAMEDLPEDSPAQEDMRSIIAAARSATHLTRQLLSFSHVRASSPSVVHLGAAVAGLRKMLGRVLGEDVHIVNDVGDELPPVLIDPVELEQVLMNLAVNARDAMPNGGTLAIEGSVEAATGELGAQLPPDRREATVVLRVRDTGCGMDPVTMARIFEPFFTTKDVGLGTGLGLSTVYAIVHRAGGGITVESTPTQGTTFVIALPPCVAKDATVAGRPRATQEGPRGTETILVVEDDEAVRVVAERILRHLGYKVLVAAGAGEALLVLEQHTVGIDLVLSDIVMPLMSGVELMERVAAVRRAPPVLFMTGNAPPELMERARQQSRWTWVQKPFTPQGLAERVRAALDDTRES